MGRTIIINESQLHVIREYENNEVLHDDFKDNLMLYLKELHDNPNHPNVGDFFKKHNISEVELQNKMLNLGLISKKDNFDEPEGADGKKRSMHTRKFAINNKNFNNNIDKLYDSFFHNGVRRKINEEDAGGGFAAGGFDGGGFAPGSTTTFGMTPQGNANGNAIMGTGFEKGNKGKKDVISRPSYNSQRKKTGDVTKQDSNVDMSPAMDRTPGFSMRRKK